jgi:hypothetical protein
MCGFDFLPAGRAGYTHKRTVSSFGFIIVHIVTLHAVTCIGAAEDEWRHRASLPDGRAGGTGGRTAILGRGPFDVSTAAVAAASLVVAHRAALVGEVAKILRLQEGQGLVAVLPHGIFSRRRSPTVLEI